MANRILYDARRFASGRFGWSDGRLARPPRIRRHPELISTKSSGSNDDQRLLQASLKRLLGGDRRLGIRDLFEPLFHLRVQREAAIASWMRWVNRTKAPPGRFIGANTLDDLPGLIKLTGKSDHAVDLVSAGEGSPIEKKFARGSVLQQKTGSIEHKLPDEVILLGGVFDFFLREKGGSDLVFAKNGAVRVVGQFASERGFTGSRKTGHDNDHRKNAL